MDHLIPLGQSFGAVTIARLIILAAQEMLSNGEIGKELLMERTVEYGSSFGLEKPEVAEILK